MKDIYKNPILYYILVPVLVAVWPLSAALYIPKAEEKLKDAKENYLKAQDVITEILNLDTGRLDFSDANSSAVQFDYAVVIERVATACRISSTQYHISSSPIISSSRGTKTQSAVLDVSDIDIEKLADFLSTLQIRWASLQCERIRLSKKKGFPDKWDANIGFKYYY